VILTCSSRLVIKPDPKRRRFTPLSLVIPCFDETPGLEHIFRPQRFLRSPPGNGMTRQKQRFGKMVAHQLEIVDDDHDGATLAVPALDNVDQIAERLGVDRVERLVEKDDISVLHKNACKQSSLQLAAGQGPRAFEIAARSSRVKRPNKPRLDHRPSDTRSTTRAGNDRSISDC
jgi:hypothetical protein